MRIRLCFAWRSGENTLEKTLNNKLLDLAGDDQSKVTELVPSEFDYVICGAGTSGCVVAARLAADPTLRVLLLEAGSDDNSEMLDNPNRWPETLGSPYDWGFTAEPNRHLNGRAIPYSMGRVLGGGSSINVSTWSRGHKADWNFFALKSGDDSWNYSAVAKLYKERVECWSGEADPDHRGTQGVVHVQPPPDPDPFASVFLNAAKSIGLELLPNSNGRMMEESGGVALIDETLVNGRRRSIYRSYLHPLIRQPNLRVLTGATVVRVLFEGKQATGVEYLYRGSSLKVRASSEVILSLGAIHTPKILMQSGIGDQTELQNHSIPLVHALPGVGRGLHDHVAIGCVWENTEKFLPRIPRSQTSCFWKSEESLDSPNFYAYTRQGAHVSPENQTWLVPPANSWSMAIGMRPSSRGRVRLTGSSPADPVRIEANYLADDQDMEDLKKGIRFAREIGNSEELKSYAGREVAPGLAGLEDIERFIRNGLSTFWHQSSTASMGCDAMSVVDSKLRVHGVKGLRVADASVMPRVTSGNTMAPCVIIGEQAALFLRNESA
jgi:choline dehydrogenase